MQSSQREIDLICNDLSEALKNDSFQGQVFRTDPANLSQKPHWGQGVVVRNMDDGLTYDKDFKVVPGTFWHDDIWPPNQIYPWGADLNTPTPRGTNIISGTGNGAWVTPTLAVAIGPEHFNAIFNSPDLQNEYWQDGVWYAHDSNSCDKRAKAHREPDYYIYDAPNAYADIVSLSDGESYQFQLKAETKGSGAYEAGNPGKNFEGGGTGMHMKWNYSDSVKYKEQYDWQINGYILNGSPADCLFCNKDCEIDYNTWNEYTKGKGDEMEKSVEGWHPWIQRFREGAEAQHTPVCAWAADLAIGWMNNPRPMITLQNALWKYREEWCDNDSDQPPEPNNFDHYWGWNEIPFSRGPITDPDNCTCFIIVLPPIDNNPYITLSQWLQDYPNVAQNLIDQLDTYEKEGYSNFQSGVSHVLVVKQIPFDSVWRRWFFTEQVEILGSDKKHGWKIDENGVIQKF